MQALSFETHPKGRQNIAYMSRNRIIGEATLTHFIAANAISSTTDVEGLIATIRMRKSHSQTLISVVNII